MRWLVALLVLDVVSVALLLTDAAESRPAEFVFVSGSEHTFLDPQRLSWSHDVRLAETMFETLVRIALPDMTFGPGTAERWDASDDGLTYTFHIRQNARWSNGDPVKASDYIYAWRRALLPDFAADYSQMLWDIRGAKAFFEWRTEQLADYAKDTAHQGLARAEAMRDEAFARFDETVGLRAIDERTLRVTLARPVPYFHQLCAWITLAAVHEPTVEPFVSLNSTTGQLVQDARWTRPGQLVSNGPYRLARRRFKRDVLLLPNEYYWNRGNMKNNSVLERIVPDAMMQLLLYEDGQVNWLPDIPTGDPIAADLVEQQLKGLRHDVHTATMAGTYYYCFNCQDKLPGGRANPLADPRVRRAFSMVIDRQTIVDKVTRMHQSVALTFVPPGAIQDYQPPVEEGVSFDPEGAKRLLAAAGYPDGKGLEGLNILYNTSSGHKDVAQQVQRSWEVHLGVSVALDGMETAVFIDRRQKQDFAVARHGWIGDYPDPTTFLDIFQSQNGNNDGKYNNPKYDALLEAAANERDPQRRMHTFREAETILLRDAAIAPIYHYIELHLFDGDRVKGLYPNAYHKNRLESVEVKK